MARVNTTRVRHDMDMDIVRWLSLLLSTTTVPREGVTGIQ